MIPYFCLPSKPDIRISLREATVSDCIDFADVDPVREEEAATFFLNRLQDKAAFRDSLEWSCEDRRFALFWHWLHTTDDCDVAIAYDCQHCGERHTYLQDYRKLLDNITVMQGLPEREIEFDGEKYVVKPLTGKDCEELESLRLGWDMSEPADRLRHHLTRTAMSVGIPYDDLVLFSAKKYMAIERLAIASMKEMRHGLESELLDGNIAIILSAHACPNKEAMTRVRVFFRAFDFLPHV